MNLSVSEYAIGLLEGLLAAAKGGRIIEVDHAFEGGGKIWLGFTVIPTAETEAAIRELEIDALFRTGQAK